MLHVIGRILESVGILALLALAALLIFNAKAARGWNPFE